LLPLILRLLSLVERLLSLVERLLPLVERLPLVVKRLLPLVERLLPLNERLFSLMLCCFSLDRRLSFYSVGIFPGYEFYFGPDVYIPRPYPRVYLYTIRINQVELLTIDSWSESLAEKTAPN